MTLPHEYIGERVSVGTIIQGGRYRFHRLQKVKDNGDSVVLDVNGLLYQVIGFAKHGVTLQDQVMYIGLDGRDKNRIFACSLNSFVICFNLEEDEKEGKDGDKGIAPVDCGNIPEVTNITEGKTLNHISKSVWG